MNARDILQAGPVVPVMVIDDLKTAPDLANALVEGGIPTLEITLRTAAGLEAIRLICREVPNAIVGAGTVLTEDQLKAVEDAGAKFVISPGLSDRFAAAAQRSSVTVIPGIATPSELMTGLEYGIDTFKFFPAEAAGGIPMLKSLAGPFADIRFCPTGGISQKNAADYLALSNVLCVGGSWLTPKEAVQSKNWAEITRLAKEASLFKKA